MDSLPMAPGTLAEMIALIEKGTISGKIGKELLPALLKGEGALGPGLSLALETRARANVGDGRVGVDDFCSCLQRKWEGPAA